MRNYLTWLWTGATPAERVLLSIYVLMVAWSTFWFVFVCLYLLVTS